MESNFIYKRDNGGRIRVWYYEIGKGPYEGHWRTVSGLLNGEKVVSEWKYAEPRSQFNAHQQAVFEATSAMTKKLKIDYKKTMDDVDKKRHSFIKPMLAQRYMGWEGLCFAQPKLDGMRAIANIDGLWSRLNNPIISVPHIEGALVSFFDDYPDIILDGELYNHDLSDDFNTIMSLTKKTKPTMEDLDKSERLIEYWIFDMFSPNNPNMRYNARWEFIKNKFESFGKPLVITPTDIIISEEMLNINFIKLLESGYEGQMIRLNNAYDQKRSSSLLKRKEYIDEEFELVDIEEGQGNWAGYAKIARCIMPDGREFGAGIAGTQEFNAQLLVEKDRYKSVTIKYFQLTPDGVPRFPIAIKFHEEMFEDLLKPTKPRKDLFR
jgi:DNA ligase 1